MLGHSQIDDKLLVQGAFASQQIPICPASAHLALWPAGCHALRCLQLLAASLSQSRPRDHTFAEAQSAQWEAFQTCAAKALPEGEAGLVSAEPSAT